MRRAIGRVLRLLRAVGVRVGRTVCWPVRAVWERSARRRAIESTAVALAEEERYRRAMQAAALAAVDVAAFGRLARARLPHAAHRLEHINDAALRGLLRTVAHGRRFR